MLSDGVPSRRMEALWKPEIPGRRHRRPLSHRQSPIPPANPHIGPTSARPCAPLIRKRSQVRVLDRPLEIARDQGVLAMGAAARARRLPSHGSDLEAGRAPESRPPGFTRGGRLGYGGPSPRKFTASKMPKESPTGRVCGPASHVDPAPWRTATSGTPRQSSRQEPPRGSRGPPERPQVYPFRVCPRPLIIPTPARQPRPSKGSET